MKLNEYQDLARVTRLPTATPAYAIINLAGETGELCSKIAKQLRDKPDEQPDDAYFTGIAKEAGDVLWQLCAVLDDHGLTLEDVAEMNLVKLDARKKANKLSGSGDDR